MLTLPPDAEILSDLMLLGANEKVRLSFPWTDVDGDLLLHEIPLPPYWSVHVTRAIRWPTDAKGKVDVDALKEKGGEPVWVAFSDDRLMMLNGILRDWPAHKHDVIISCTDSHYQRWNQIPCREAVGAQVLASKKKKTLPSGWPDEILALLTVPVADLLRLCLTRLSDVEFVTMSGLRDHAWSQNLLMFSAYKCWEVPAYFEQLSFSKKAPLPEELPAWYVKLRADWHRYLGDPSRPPHLTNNGVSGSISIMQYGGHWVAVLDDQGLHVVTDAPVENLLSIALKLGEGEKVVEPIPEPPLDLLLDNLVDSLLDEA